MSDTAELGSGVALNRRRKVKELSKFAIEPNPKLGDLSLDSVGLRCVKVVVSGGSASFLIGVR